MDFDSLFVFFVTLFIWNIFEMIMLRNWVAWFYMLSIPVYKKTFHFSQYIDHKELVSKISDPIEGKNSVIYHLFDDNKISFREVSKFAFTKRRSNYTPLMRGLIEYDLVTKTMTVTGLMNLSTLFFFGVFIAFVFYGLTKGGGEVGLFRYIFYVAPFFVFGLVFIQQSKVYNEIVDYLKKLLRSVQY